MLLLVLLSLGIIALFIYSRFESLISIIPSATPKLPIIGNAKSFRADPVQYLLTQRALHGDIFTLHLGFLDFVFFLGPEGTNAVLSGTEKTGISLFVAVSYFFGKSFEKGGYPQLFRAN